MREMRVHKGLTPRSGWRLPQTNLSRFLELHWPLESGREGMWVVVWVSTLCAVCEPIVDKPRFATELQCLRYRVAVRDVHWDAKGKCVPERRAWPRDFPADQTYRG